MKAIAKTISGPGLELIDVVKPAPGIDEILVRIEKTSICGTDVHIHSWDAWATRTIKPPLVIGHEFTGQIAAIGANVKGFKIGERICGEGHIVCGQCRNCLAGQRHLCPNTRGVGIHRDGAFAEYLCIPAANAWHTCSDISTDVLSCMDPLGNAAHTALSFDLLGEDVLVTGAGPIGCMAIGIARHAGARHIVAVEPNVYRRQTALKMGASLAIDPQTTELSDTMKQLSMEEGFDVGFEMSGNSSAFSSMVEVMIHGGKIAVLGILSDDAQINWNTVIFNSLTIKGIYGRKMYETWYKVTMMLQGGLDIEPIITHRLHYTDFQEAFRLMKSGQSGKIILNWE